ncbi:hypothetical protein HMPREF0454_02006 [Hafnia alvei ATCC 51873]|uniref:Uncharacterized protein n=1 Tax=Hafnia alvei ATCC 51873 TaxID=1002364 RepID=G9Y5Z0_HAFAL|nr:hypothetical protein HMPREF0454_02006 [Hafnia alvei ATCC 51873]
MLYFSPHLYLLETLKDEVKYFAFTYCIYYIKVILEGLLITIILFGF